MPEMAGKNNKYLVTVNSNGLKKETNPDNDFSFIQTINYNSYFCA
jgi:hypothetical protein